MTKRKLNKRWVFGYLIALLLLAPLFIALFLYNNPQFTVNYKLFRPQKIPQNLVVTHEELEVWSQGGLTDFIITNTILNFALNRDGSYISLTKVTTQNEIIDPNQGLWCKTTNSECHSKITPAGQKYLLKYESDQFNKPWNETAIFVKDGTYITIRIETRNQDRIPESEWNESIDSFAPTSLGSPAIRHYRPGP